MKHLRQVYNRKLEGTVRLPASKSISNRWLIIQALAGARIELLALSESHDVTLLARALKTDAGQVHFEDAGTPLRFYLAYAALKGLRVTIDGDERLRARPVRPLLQALEQLGAEFTYLDQDGSLPLSIKKGVDTNQRQVHLDAALSSQFLSALLLIAPCFNQGLQIMIDGKMVSGPYVALTLEAMQEAGVGVQAVAGRFTSGPGAYQKSQAVTVEADWSAATFLYALASLSGEADVLLGDLSLNSSQGDRFTAELFGRLGVESTQEGNGVRIRRTGDVGNELRVDFTDIPDMFPAVAAVCAALRISVHFTGVRHLLLKESNRIEAMRFNLEQTGVLLHHNDDLITYEFTGREASSYHFNAFNDHRIAMACSIFALKKNIVIDDATVVKKSFPDYWDMLDKLFV
jgi:3-phosphoshikimate 1-carboxyvinyltransferase